MKKFLFIFLLAISSILCFHSAILAQISIPSTTENTIKATTISLIQLLSDGKTVKAGSGVIIAQDKGWYDVLTVAHNLRLEEPEINQNLLKKQLKIDTEDGNIHNILSIDHLRHPRLGYLDLAVIQFRSILKYKTASFLNAQRQPITQNQSIVRQNDRIYVGGFPQSAAGFRIDEGHFLEFMTPWSQSKDPSHPYQGGYSLRYKAMQNKGMDSGMSGGGIWDTQGNLLGIHGRYELWNNEIKLGIGVDIFWQSIPISLQNRILENHNSSLFLPSR